jgi:hypothetical protein
VRRPKPQYAEVVQLPLRSNVTSLADFAEKAPSPKKGASSTSKARVEQIIGEVAAMRTKRSFADARPSHFVALYIQLHAQVYGVRPSELMGGKEWSYASIAAARLLEREFSGNKEQMVDFLSWLWTRERKSHARAKANDEDRRRLGWRLVFSARLVTDYKVALLNHASR